MKFKQLREKYRSKYPASLVAAAVKIAIDMSGNMTGAYKKIEAMKKGLADDPIVADTLKQANESVNEGKEEYIVKKGNFTRKVDGKTADKMKRQGWKLVAKEDLQVAEAMKIKDIFKKHKRELTKAYKTGDLSFNTSAGKKAEDDLMKWAMNNGEVNTDDPDDFFDWLSRDLEDIVKGKIKEQSLSSVEEGKVKELQGYIDSGKSAQWISKKMKIDIKHIKSFMDEAVGPEEKAQLALKQAKEVETLKKKHEREKENMKEDTIAEAKVSFYGSEIKGLIDPKNRVNKWTAKPVDYKGKLGYKITNQFGDFETLDLKAFARKFG